MMPDAGIRPDMRIERQTENLWQGREVAVVGAGIAGMMTALRLQSFGAIVTIYSPIKPGGIGWGTQENPALMASEVAGASWKPYHLDFPNPALTEQILQDSWDWNTQLIAEGVPGIVMMRHYEASNSPIDMAAKAFYLDIVKPVDTYVYDTDHPSPLPGGYHYAISYNTIHFNPRVALPALVERFESLGGQFQVLERNFDHEGEMTQLPADVIFNCTGLGAAQLIGDTKLHPEAGEVIEYPPIAWRDGEEPFSISAIPDLTDTERRIGHLANLYEYTWPDHVTAGGTGYPGILHHVRRGVRGFIQRGAKSIFGERIDTRRGIARVGLRPSREGGVRNETEVRYQADGKRVVLVHNYGHGGAGWTTAAGTAIYAVLLAERDLTQ